MWDRPLCFVANLLVVALFVVLGESFYGCNSLSLIVILFFLLHASFIKLKQSITKQNLGVAKIPRQNNLFGKNNLTISSLIYFDFESVLSHIHT